jgi:collagen triple helix repeat protein
MAKLKQGARGERGIPGPPGPPGVSGSDGTRGLTGKAGPVGAAGHTGHTGARGAKGATGSKAPASGKGRKRFIAAVDRHIENIYGELTVQMKRMARIQLQVDELRDKIRKAL